MTIEEITEPSDVSLTLAKTNMDNQLMAVRPTDTALFAAHSPKDSYILLQHREKITLWKLEGDMSARCAFKKELEDKLRDMANSSINPGDNIEYFRNEFNLPQ